MRRHPVDGAKIIYESDRQLDWRPPWRTSTTHDQRRRLSEPSLPARVPQASKLVHICDVYDALRTTRPYREAWEPDRILQQIEKGIGWDFDEEISRAFIQMMGQWSVVLRWWTTDRLPQYAAAMLEANRESSAAAVSAAARRCLGCRGG